MVVMSIEAFERLDFESEVLAALREAEWVASLTSKRFSLESHLRLRARQ